jgi:hypothetical protein
VIYVGLGLKGNGRVNEILGQGHAIHDFGATFIYNSPDSKKYSWQIPIEFKFTSRPKGCYKAKRTIQAMSQCNNYS